jgi:SAM-dependent methyltransferase
MEQTRTMQSRLDERNSEFWNELCGTSLARSLGIETVDRESLRRFDDAYMAYYPYLWRYLELDRIRDAHVLEIGLGFGTVGGLLAAADAVYHGVDIARGPVEMMRQRLLWAGIDDGTERVVQGSALALPFEQASFDRIYSIGCLHHTGDLQRAVDEVHRVLAPGGRALVMLYNRLSLRLLVAQARARMRRRGDSDEWLRSRYDANAEGDAAPHTDYVSKREARQLFAGFERVRIDVQNFDPLTLPGGVQIPRERFLGNVARVLGVDLYIVARKSELQRPRG